MFDLAFSEIFKNYIACVLSVSTALSSAATVDNAALGYNSLSLKTLDVGAQKTEISFSVSLDADAISSLAGTEIPDIPGVVSDGKLSASGSFNFYSDIENMRFAITDSDSKEGIFADSESVAFSPAVTPLLFLLIDSTEEDDHAKAYLKYFPDKGLFVSLDGIYDYDFYDTYDELALNLVNDVLKAAAKEENISDLSAIVSPVLELGNEYYGETVIDGCKAYSYKISGFQAIDYIDKIYAHMFSEKTANDMFDYILGLLDDIDYMKYVEKLTQELSEEEVKLLFAEYLGDSTPDNKTITAFIKQAAEEERETFVADYTAFYNDNLKEILTVLATGKDNSESGTYSSIVKMFGVISSYLKNSYVTSTVYEKDGAVITDYALVISNGNSEILGFDYSSKSSACADAFPVPSQAVPFENRIEYDDVLNKAGYENAKKNGVRYIDIVWESGMNPGDLETQIYGSSYFEVYYDILQKDEIINSDEFKDYDEETKQLILGMLSDDDCVSNFSNTTVYVIDNSVYLPLRQITENAGYDVSWDAEAKKAYVTVDGKKTDMTGTLINNRTYVKIRDFEKLGASVEYSEDFYYTEAPDNYMKSCCATVTFAK